jgi:hypothetical protein
MQKTHFRSTPLCDLNDELSLIRRSKYVATKCCFKIIFLAASVLHFCWFNDVTVRLVALQSISKTLAPLGWYLKKNEFHILNHKYASKITHLLGSTRQKMKRQLFAQSSHNFYAKLFTFTFV